MAAATTHAPRRAQAKRIVRRAHTKATRTVRPIATRRNWRMVSLVAVGTLVALGAAAMAAAAFDPRVEEAFRRGLRSARGAMDDLPALPSPRGLANLADQFSDAGQKLGDVIRATAKRF